MTQQKPPSKSGPKQIKKMGTVSAVRQEEGHCPVIVDLTQPGVIWKEGSQLKGCLDQTGLHPCLWETVLTDDLCGKAQPITGSTIPRQMILGCEEGWLHTSLRVSQQAAFLRGFSFKFLLRYPT